MRINYRPRSRVREMRVPPRTTLGHHVIHVVLMGTNKEMARVTARWIVAMMANIKVTWNSSVMNLPRQSMSCERFGVIFNSTVAASGCASSPNPAMSEFTSYYWTIFIYPTPKPIQQRLDFLSGATNCGIEARAFEAAKRFVERPDPVSRTLKRLAAKTTYAVHKARWTPLRLAFAGTRAILVPSLFNLPRKPEKGRSTGFTYTIWNSHDLNLRDRFELWLGSFSVQALFGPFSLEIIA